MILGGASQRTSAWHSYRAAGTAAAGPSVARASGGIARRVRLALGPTLAVQSYNSGVRGSSSSSATADQASLPEQTMNTSSRSLSYALCFLGFILPVSCERSSHVDLSTQPDLVLPPPKAPLNAGTLYLTPLSAVVENGSITVDLLAEGPQGSTIHAAEILRSSIVHDPGQWLEISHRFGGNVQLHSPFSKRDPVHFLPLKPIEASGSVVRTVVPVFAQMAPTHGDPSALLFRLAPSAPYLERLRAIGGASGIRQVNPDTQWRSAGGGDGGLSRASS